MKHLKPLFIRGHINGSLVSRILINGGFIVNLMLYMVFKKLELNHDDLLKTNMVLNGFEGKEQVEARGVLSLELAVRSKTLATAFFVADV